jgi:hypothetical protein
LLSKGSGVALGAYLGFHAAADAPLFLYAAVPGGMLVCCTVAGVAEALQLGLRERILSWLAGSTRREEKQPSEAQTLWSQISQSTRGNVERRD